MSQLPALSHLQVLVLECLGTRKVSGRELRGMLLEKGTNRHGPAFYRLMSRMEEAELVQGEYSTKIVEGQIIKERIYCVTGEGERALRATLSFYANLQGSLGWEGGLRSV